MENTNILIICTGNSCRSQIAEGYFKFFKNKMKLKINILSAGIKAEGINPKAAEIMLKDHIYISGQTSNKIDEYINENITHVITVCDHANENCPVFLKKTHFTHQNFKDPSKVIGNKEEIQLEFDNCREEIKNFSKEYLKANFRI